MLRMLKSKGHFPQIINVRMDDEATRQALTYNAGRWFKLEDKWLRVGMLFWHGQNETQREFVAVSVHDKQPDGQELSDDSAKKLIVEAAEKCEGKAV